MLFVVLNRFANWPEEAPSNAGQLFVTLKRNTWDDYGHKTTFDATLHNGPGGTTRSLGEVKFMRRGQQVGEKSFSILPSHFVNLGPDFCSLGQSLSFYEELKNAGDVIAQQYSQASNDAALIPGIREAFQEEEAFRVSLLRTSDALEAIDKAASLFGEREAEQHNAFEVVTRLSGAAGDHRIQFDFGKFNGLPHRTSVLVGLNGVGKTAFMARLAFLLTRFESKEKEKLRTAAGETFEALGSIEPRPSIYGVIAVSFSAFSAFDDFELPESTESSQYRYVYCGLRKKRGGFRSIDEVSKDVVALVAGMSEAQLTYLHAVLPQITSKGNSDSIEEYSLDSELFYKKLSAGQRISLNIICELIVNIQSQSIILLDEPETHLHPQLLGTLMAILGDMLEASNSFAIVATHSPIVVQQVPSRSVFVIRRVLGRPIVEHPRIECFGENLTEIVRTVFEAVESDRDYEQVIDRLLVENGNDAIAVEGLFDGKIGLNARLYLHSRAVK